VDVYEAVASRRAVRGLTDQPVPTDVLERVLSAAAWTPSGSNSTVAHLRADRRIAGAAQEARRRARRCRRPLGRAGVRDVPARTESPYGERRSAFGKERYSALGIERGLGGASEGRHAN